jgi:acetylserotonin N-methyltransferase
MQSMNMLVNAEGRERSAAEYEALLRVAGFSKVESCVTHSYLDAVLAIK